MLRSAIKLVLLVAVYACVGACSKVKLPANISSQGPSLPRADDIVEVRCIPPVGAPDTRWPAATLTHAEDIRAAVDWLGTIDWSKAPRDISVMDLQPQSTLRFVKRDGTELTFMVGDSSIIYGQGLWAADTDAAR